MAELLCVQKQWKRFLVDWWCSLSWIQVGREGAAEPIHKNTNGLLQGQCTRQKNPALEHMAGGPNNGPRNCFPLFPIPRQRILGYLEVIYCNIFILVLSEVLKDTMESDKHYVMTYGCFKRDNQMKKVPYLEEHCCTGTTKTKFIQMSVSQWKMLYCWMLMILEKNIS